MAKSDTNKDYKILSDNLENIISLLQDDKTSIDESLKLYEQANKLVEELSEYLKTAENKLTQINSKTKGQK